MIRLAPVVLGTALLLAGAAGVVADTALLALAKTVEQQVAHFRKQIPDLDLSPFGVDELVKAALEGSTEETDRIRRDLTGAALRMNQAAKRHTLGKLHELGREVVGSPTDAGNYLRRRDLILTFDFIERAFGNPIYPQNLGRPFVSLVQIPSDRHFKLVDAYLGWLATIPVPPPPAPAESSGPGPSGGPGPGGDESDPGQPSGWSPSISDPDPDPGSGGPRPIRPVLPDESTGGWLLVRYYVLATLGAIFLVYLTYLVYNAMKGGRNALHFLLHSLRLRSGPNIGPEDVPFRKGLKLFSRGRERDALMVLEPLIDGGGPDSQAALYYALRAYLRLGQSGDLKKQFGKLDPGRFSLDELYVLATALHESEEKVLAVQVFEGIRARDATFKDVAQKLAGLGAGEKPPAG